MYGLSNNKIFYYLYIITIFLYSTQADKRKKINNFVEIGNKLGGSIPTTNYFFLPTRRKLFKTWLKRISL
jgi:hypothetical protein